MKVRFLVTAIAVASLVGAFQNCSEGLPEAALIEDQSSVLPSFSAGDNFDYRLVPNASAQVSAQLSAKSYATVTGPKAVAVAATGLGFVSVLATAPGVTQDDANLIALQGCFVISGARPCALLAAGDKFARGRDELPGAYTFTMNAPVAPLTAAAVPFVTAARAAALATQYNSSTQPNRALALSLDGTAVFIANGMAGVPGAVGSVAEAARIALERCEMMATLVPCTVIAQGGSVVFNPSSINRSAVIPYNQQIVSGTFPGHTAALGEQQITNRWDLRAANAGAIYLSADGHFGEDLDPNPAVARATALNQCNTGVTAAYPCFPYADTGAMPHIVFGPKNLTAYKNIELHCKAVPRLNCTQHRLLGCPPGRYYTTFTGAVLAEDCN